MLSTPHIPAWKKLGLKLKNGQDLATVPQGADFHHQESKKKGVLGLKADAKKAIGAEVNPPRTAGLPQAGGLTQSSSPSQRPASNLPAKTVSFTADTKGADVGSSQRLHHKQQADQVAGSDTPSFNGTINSVSQGSSEASPSTTERKSKKPKKPKKPKEPGQSTESKSPQDHSARSIPTTTSDSASAAKGDLTKECLALQYLRTYHSDRQSWKFNKSRQTYILKNMYSEEKIPPEYDDALKSYLEGLSGENVRARVSGEAFKIMVDVEEKIDATKVEASKELAQNPSSGKDSGVRKSPSAASSMGEPATQGLSAEKPPSEHPLAQGPSAPTSTIPGAGARTEATNGTKRPAESADEFNRLETKRRKIELEYREHAFARYKQPFRQRETPYEEYLLQKDVSWRRHLFARRRADLLLWAVPEATLFEHTETAPMTLNPPVQAELISEICGRPPGDVSYENRTEGAAAGAAGASRRKRRRKRKRRTGVPDDDSSEDESSTDSSEGGFARGDADWWKGKAKGKASEENRKRRTGEVTGKEKVTRGTKPMADERSEAEGESSSEEEDEKEETSRNDGPSDSSSEESSDAESLEDGTSDDASDDDDGSSDGGSDRPEEA